MGETLTNLLTSRNAMSAELKNVGVYLKVALDNMGRGLSMFDGNQRLIVCNNLYTATYGLPDNLARPGTSLAKIIRHYMVRETGRDDEEAVAQQLEWIRKETALLATGSMQTRTQILQDGRAIRVTTQPLATGGWVDIHEDVSEQLKRDCALTQRASHDAQTGFMHPGPFNDHLTSVLASPSSGQFLALHTLELLNYRSLREEYGYAVREAIVQELAKRFQSVANTQSVGRAAGDMFVALQPVADRSGAAEYAGELQCAIPSVVDVMGHKVEIAVEIRTAFLVRPGELLDQLIDRAQVSQDGARPATSNVVSFRNGG